MANHVNLEYVSSHENPEYESNLDLIKAMAVLDHRTVSVFNVGD